ncbi:VOC family protein [Iodidimonas sp. SYSU 1G8]|uniref:VOC family protein n=1 Tax=Iodidimonas sp. SYSU 1G8 TaxID=3133967 RepID=UPI0031FF1C33
MTSLICGIHHVGVNVPDLEAGRKFYEDVFGFEVIGVDKWDEGNADVNAYVGMDESSADSYMLRGANTYLEIWTYRTPASNGHASERRASDHGYTHLAFQVTDFETVLARFLAAGGSVIKPLTKARPGGARLHYCRDPFGNIIELLEMPAGSRTGLGGLPGIAAEGAFAPPTRKYYVLENGEFAGLRDKSDLPGAS